MKKDVEVKIGEHHKEVMHEPVELLARSKPSPTEFTTYCAMVRTPNLRGECCVALEKVQTLLQTSTEYYKALYCSNYVACAAYDAPKKWPSGAVHNTSRQMAKQHAIPFGTLRSTAKFQKLFKPWKTLPSKMNDIIEIFDLEKIREGQEKARVIWPTCGKQLKLG